MRRPITALLGLALALPATATAQLCWRAQRTPRCLWFAVTRFGGELSIARTGPALSPDKEALSWELGLARNVASRYALGTILRVGTPYNGNVSLGVLGRAWLTSTVALDVKPGIVVRAEPNISFPTQMPAPDRRIDSWTHGNVPAATLGLSLSVGEWGLVTLSSHFFSYDQVSETVLELRPDPTFGSSWWFVSQDQIPRRGSFFDHRLGVQLGSYPGAIGIALSALVAGFAAVFILPGIQN